jgi:hypothetical protein
MLGDGLGRGTTESVSIQFEPLTWRQEKCGLGMGSQLNLLTMCGALTLAGDETHADHFQGERSGGQEHQG